MNELLLLAIMSGSNAAIIISLGKWGVYDYINFKFGVNTCLFCLSFWLAVVETILYLSLTPGGTAHWMLIFIPWAAAGFTNKLLK